MKKNKSTFLIYIFIGLFLVVFLFPVYWMVVSSFHPNAELMSYPPKFTLKNATLDNYKSIFSQAKYLVYFKNRQYEVTSLVCKT